MLECSFVYRCCRVHIVPAVAAAAAKKFTKKITAVVYIAEQSTRTRILCDGAAGSGGNAGKVGRVDELKVNYLHLR